MWPYAYVGTHVLGGKRRRRTDAEDHAVKEGEKFAGLRFMTSAVRERWRVAIKAYKVVFSVVSIKFWAQ